MFDKINTNGGTSAPNFNTNLNHIDLSPIDHAEGNVPDLMKEYQDRMRVFKMKLDAQCKKNNTTSLQNRLKNLDLHNLDNKDKVPLEYLIKNANEIRTFARNNDYEISAIDFRTLDKAVEAAKTRLQLLKNSINGEQKTELGKEFYADTYQTGFDRKFSA